MEMTPPDASSPLIDPDSFFRRWAERLADPLVVVRVDNGTVAFANRALCELTGRKLLGAPLTALFPPEHDRDTDLWFREWVALASTGEAPSRSAAFIRCADGVDRPYEIDATLFEAVGVRLASGLFRPATDAPSASVELLQARDLLAMSQRLMDAGSWEWRLKENRLFWTPQTYRIFGVDPRAFVPTVEAFLGMIHPDDRPLYDGMIARLPDFTSTTLEFRIVRPGGESRRLRDFITIVTDREGAPERLVGAVQDITEQWRVDEAFRLVAAGIGAASEREFFESLTRSLTELLAMDMAFVAELDDTGALLTGIAVSPRGDQKMEIPVREGGACRKMLAEKRLVAIERGVSDLYPDLPAPAGVRFEGMAGAPLLSRAGEPLGVMVVLKGAPLRDEEHALALLGIFSQRASVELERLRSVRALTRSEARLQSVIQTTMQGFWLIDSEAVTLEVNARMAAILGIDAKELPGRSIYDFVDEANAAIFRAQLRERGAGRHSSYEITLNRADGDQVACLFGASPFFDDRGIQRGSFALVSDITDRKRVEEELRKSEASLNRAQRIARIGS
ncbi:MAG: PAS domain S-box protein, partial [Nitrospinae bacterium]|nr:PAS domain S-box protein [Nitrospinota bacterium]